MSKRKEYVKAIIDEILGDDEKISKLSNELFGGIMAIQSVYEAVEVYKVDKEILKKHIDRIFEQSLDNHATLKKGSEDEPSEGQAMGFSKADEGES